MTKSEMEWEAKLDERANSIARRFAIEDLALKYRTSLETAEKLLAKEVLIEKQDRAESPKPSEVIEIDGSLKQIKTEEDMDVDVDGVEPYSRFHREKVFKRNERHFRPIKSPPLRAQNGFVYPVSSTNHVTPFHRGAYQNPRYAFQTWPYCVTYPYQARDETFARKFRFLPTHAGLKTLPTYPSIHLLRNRLITGEETSRVFTPPIQRPLTQTRPEERTREEIPSEERYREYTRERPRDSVFSNEKRTFSSQERNVPVPITLGEKGLLFSGHKPWDCSSKGNKPQLYEQRPRSYTPPTVKGDVTTEYPGKPRRHSDDSVTNFHRPSVIVMQKSLSNPVIPSNEEAEESNYKQHTCHDDHQLSDTDSSDTPPLPQEGSASGGESSKGEIIYIPAKAIQKKAILVAVFFCGNIGSITDDLYWTSRKKSLELIELSSINKVSLV